MTIRPLRAASMIAGCAALAGLAGQAPAVAAHDHAPDGRAVVAGSAPSWATASTRVGNVDSHAHRHVQVALALRDQADAEKLAREISTPGTANYRKTLNSAQFAARFAPTQQTVDEVTAWLRGQGLQVTGVSGNRHLVDADADTSTLEHAFGTTLQKFRHTTEGVSKTLVAPTHDISLPVQLRTSVTAVLGLDDSEQLIRPQRVDIPRPAATAAAATSCATSWGQTVNKDVPQRYASQSNVLCGYGSAQAREIYGLGAGATGAGVSIGIVGAYNSATTASDANRAAARFGAPPLATGQYSSVDPAGGYKPDPACEPDSWSAEQALDVQAAHTMAPAAKITYYGAADCRTLFDGLNTAVSDNKAGIVSASWGFSGGEASVPAAARQQMDAIGTQAAIQGQSLLVSSGDTGDSSGVAGRPTASFPASHPWVTGVGGTSVGLDARGQRVVETGWSSTANTLTNGTWTPTQDADGPFAGGSGGGVSTVYSRPDYQNGAVSTAKRSVPDISALADAYTGFAVGTTVAGRGYVEYSSGGTSLAAPLMAGLVADSAQAASTDRLGFLNPAIYQLAKTGAVRDVTHQATGVWTPSVVGYGGVTVPRAQGSYLIDFDGKPQTLQSGPGWDPVTGVGTPSSDFVKALAQ
jgi:subtilase family serine protease